MTAFFANILIWIDSIVGNYGVALILFTLLFRLLVTPLDFRSRKSMRKMQLVQPKVTALQKKYANDQQKMNQKMSELYKKEGISPLSGCVPMLLSLPILWIMFAAMRQISNTELAKQAFVFLSGETPVYEPFLWIRNLWMPDSPFSVAAPSHMMLSAIPADIWQTVYDGLSEVQLAALPELAYDFSSSGYSATVTAMYEYMSGLDVFTATQAAVPGWANINLLLTKVTIFREWNGLYILPILAAVTQFAMTKVTSAQQDEQQQSGGMNAFMKWFFPIFSLWICATSNAGFSAYWVVANVFAIAQTVIINKVLDHQDALKAEEQKA